MKIVKLKAGDKFPATTIKDCCKMVFGQECISMRARFYPEPLKEKYGTEYSVWFGWLDGTSHGMNDAKWQNIINKDGTEIEMFYRGSEAAVKRCAAYHCIYKICNEKILCFRKIGHPQTNQVVEFEFIGMFMDKKINQDENGNYEGRIWRLKSKDIEIPLE